MDREITVEPWSVDPTRTHVYTDPVWKDDIHTCFGAVISDFTIGEVEKIISWAKWGENKRTCSCTVLRDICHEVSSNRRRDISVTKKQLNRLGFPADDLSDLEVAWLRYVADSARKDAASYATDPFVDPIRFDPDELWAQLAEWFEANTGELTNERTN